MADHKRHPDSFWPKGVFFLRTFGRPVFERSEPYDFVMGGPRDHVPRVGDIAEIRIGKEQLFKQRKRVRVMWHKDAFGRWWLVETK